MTFLQKLGRVLSVITNLAGIAAGVGPILQPFLGSKGGAVEGKVVNDLTAIGQTIAAGEAFLQTPGSGPAKLAAATPLVANIVRTSELISGHKIANETLFIQGCSKMTSGMADILNSLHADGIPIDVKPLSVSTAPATAA